MPRSLDLNRLRQFEPAARDGQIVEEGRAEALAERWPSREAARDGQISIKAPLETLRRFRRLCREDRRTYADMLAILMNTHEHERRDG